MYSKRFNDAIDSLVQGFMDGTLAKGSCHACAVGNMVAKRSAINITRCKDTGSLCWQGCVPQWYSYIYENPEYRIDRMTNYLGMKECTTTGYSVKELRRIESAFEGATKIPERLYKKKGKKAVMADQYAGLMAVLDVLMDIEGIEEDKSVVSRFDYLMV